MNGNSLEQGVDNGNEDKWQPAKVKLSGLTD
jgi:hypothetical protein